MSDVNKVVLAYSGGLDTSVILKWLQDTYQCEVVTFTADLGQGEELEPARTKALKFGIRPENLTLAPQGANDIAVPAEVALLEPLGAETLVTLKVGNAEMVARCSAAFRQPPGTALAVHMGPQHLHLFDASTGAAI